MTPEEQAVVDAAVAYRKALGDACATYVDSVVSNLILAVDALHRSSRLERWREAAKEFTDNMHPETNNLCMSNRRYEEIRDAFREMLSELEGRCLSG